MKKIFAISFFLVALLPCYSQSVKENIRFSFIAAIDYSANIYSIHATYVRHFNSLEDPGLVDATVQGKPAFGLGMRFEYQTQGRLNYSLSVILLDKGYGIYQEGISWDGVFRKQKYHYGKLYWCIPVEVVYKFNSSLISPRIRMGISIDLCSERQQDLNPVASSLVLGFSRPFLINDIMLLAIEPTFRIGITKYGEQVQILPDKFDVYQPFSAGIIISLTQLPYKE